MPGYRKLYRFPGGLIHDLKKYNGPAVPIGATIRNSEPIEDKK